MSSGVFVLFVVVMWFVARPALAWLDGKETISAVRPALALAVLLLAALATDSLGAEAVVGAFLAGLILPRSAGYRTINSKIEGLTEWLLLPMFFISIGLQTQIAALGSVRDILLCLGILIVAIASKSVATLLVARSLGIGWQSTSLLAAMMNCRGITALIVLQVGLSMALLNQKLFAIFTVVSIFTTLMTSPALDVIERIGSRRRAPSRHLHPAGPDRGEPQAGAEHR